MPTAMDVLNSTPTVSATTQPPKPEAAPAAAAVKSDANANDAPPTTPQVRAAVVQIQKFLDESERSIEFRVDDVSGMPVVTVRDANSGDVIRQLPNEETLRLAQILKEESGVNNALLNLSV